MSDKTPTVKALLKKATLPERIIPIVMDRALAGEFERLESQLEDAARRRKSDVRVASELRDIAKQMNDVREKMRASTIEFQLRGMRGSEWRALKAENPIGDEPTPVDAYMNADMKAVLNEGVRRSIVSPALDEEDWENLLGALTHGEWTKLTDAVYAMNEEETGLPFSRAASMLLQASDDE